MAVEMDIEFRDFSFAHPDSEPLLSGVSAAVQRGALALLVGKTGCGKTTLLTCLKPELRPVGTYGGTVRVAGRELQGNLKNAGIPAGQIGYVSQNPDNQLVCNTVWHELAFGLENLGMPQEDMRRRVAEVAHFFGISNLVQRECASLSGGQKQLVNLASALAMQPKILLLDEPTAQLDPVAEKSFLHALFRINRELGITVVVATHAPETMAEYATQAFQLTEAGLSEVSLDTFRLTGMWDPSWYSAKQIAEQKSPVVEVKDAFVRYGKKAEWVLRGCDFAAAPGAMHAIVGGNGSGKSTLLRSIARVMKTERGRVINRLNDAQVLLPQNPQALFMCDSVFEELREWQAGAGYTDAEIAEMLNAAGLAGRENVHPYDLSGGQQQKLALAKLLLTKPKLLLLDEPTKGLDAESKLVVAQMLQEAAANGATVIAAMHDLAFAACVFQEVSMVFDGDITCTQSARDFFEGNLFYIPHEDAFVKAYVGEGHV